MFSLRSRIPAGENRITRTVEALRGRGARLLDLTLSNPTGADLPYPRDLLVPLSTPAAFPYQPDPRGSLTARQAIAAHCGGPSSATGPAMDPHRLWLTSGTSEAYGMLFKLLCDPGGQILIPQPGYPLFEHLARLEGVRTRPYPLRYDGRWYIDMPALRAAIGPTTRALVCVNPNNPTGSYLKRDELLALADLGLPIISDEVFSAFPLQADATRVDSALTCPRVPVFCLGGLSKFAGMPQVKLSWIALGGDRTHHDELAARLDLIGDCYLSVGAPVQAATEALLTGTECVRAAIRRRLSTNYARLQVICSPGSPLSLLHTEGGWYAVLRLPSTLDEEAWVLRLLNEVGVVVQPGYFFDFDEGVHVVVSLLVPEADFATGTERLAQEVVRALTL
ncbi:MAG: pyridoxal phosphate-dependent aminotransferase [Myxococcales bacterium]|nr:pyridoxal phosphate-dependent aminotransferase [Myxococcales bacterium]